MLETINYRIGLRCKQIENVRFYYILISELILILSTPPWDCWNSGWARCRWKLSQLCLPCQWSPSGPRYGKEFYEVVLETEEVSRSYQPWWETRDTLPDTGTLPISGSIWSGSSPGIETFLLRTYRYMLLIACLIFTRSSLTSSN